MAPRLARGRNNQSLRLPLLVLLFALLPSLAAAQVRDWAVSYDSGSYDRLGCSICDQYSGGLRPATVGKTRTLAADAQGNSWIAAGSSNATNTDILTIKYDVDGNRQWAVTYDGGGNDSAFAIGVDGAGNAYVAGTIYRMTPEYGSQPHALLLKYDPSGTLLWERVYRASVWTQGMVLAVDVAGNSYFGVHNYGANGLAWAELRKISPAGVLLGVHSPSFGFDYDSGPTAVTLDAAGNAYLAGWLYKPRQPRQTDYFVLKFGSWAALYDSGSEHEDIAHDVAVDGSGRVFVTGNRGTVAYSSTGAALWVAPFSGTPHAVVAGDGGVWVAGTDHQTGNFRTDRYDPATGAPLWSKTSGGPEFDYVSAMRAVGGVVYVTGGSADGTYEDALIVGLDAVTGAEVWQDRYDNGDTDRVFAIAAAGGGLWIAGHQWTGVQPSDTLLIRYELATGPAVSALSLAPATFPGGCQSSSGRVTLSAPAPAGGTVVALASTNPVAVIPASVTVPAGQTRATFPITAPAVSSLQTGTVTATAGGQSRSATLRVRPIGVLALVLGPNPVTGPSPVDGSVLLECAAAPGPITVQLTSSNEAVAWPNVSSIVIPAGAATGRFTVSTADVDVTRYVILKAATGGTSKTVSLEVR